MLSLSNERSSDQKGDKLLTAGLFSVILAGILLRIYFYAANRGLWNDELAIAVSIVERDFAGLATPPLAYDQQAPLLFLFSLKGIALLLGSHGELALRLFPLLSGIAATVGFYYFARVVLPRPWVLFAQLCFAFGIHLVYYSAEIKQYETEVLAAILAYLLFFRFESRRGFMNALAWGLAGGALLWFSYSVLFILAATGGYVLWRALAGRKFAHLSFLIPVGTIWLTSFLVNYWLIISHGTQLEWLAGFWRNKDAFMPLPPRNAAELLWLPNALLRAVSMPLGMKWPLAEFGYKANLIPVLLMTAGAYRLVRTEKKLAFILLVPLGLVLLVSSTGKYPFSGRLLLFYVPVFIILITHGIILIANAIPGKAGKVGASVLAASLVAIPVVLNGISLMRANSPEIKTYSRELIGFIAGRSGEINRENARIYFHASLDDDVRYYKHLYALPENAVVGTTPLIASEPDVQAYQEAVKKDFSLFASKEKVLVMIPKGEVVPFYREKGQRLPAELDLFTREVAARGDFKLVRETPKEQLYLLTVQ